MKSFMIYPEIVEYDNFAEFAQSEKLGENDLILTNEFIYDPFMKGLNLKCKRIFQEKYGRGEPNDQMIAAIQKDIPETVTRIIAVGGGTIIDISKFLTLEYEGSVEDVFMGRVAYKASKKLLIVPTTCGTGSEVTNISITELTNLQIKKGLAVKELYAQKAILIPEMIYTLPYQFFATSSIDAFAHSVESYLSPKATVYSKMFGEKAMQMIIAGFKYTIKNGQDKWKDKATEFIQASNFAGIAFGNAGCAAVHALGYPISGKYHIPHGEAIDLLLVATLKKYKELETSKGVLGELEAFLAKELNCQPDQVFDELNQLLDAILPRKPLREYGMKEEDFRPFSEGVIKEQQRLLLNNYLEFSVEDMIDIYKRLY